MRDLNDLMIGPKKSGVPSVPPAPKIAPEPEEIPTLKRMKGGMVAGAFAGFVAAKFYMDWQASDTPVGTFYEGQRPFAVRRLRRRRCGCRGRDRLSGC